jgi:hypothetical protein
MSGRVAGAASEEGASEAGAALAAGADGSVAAPGAGLISPAPQAVTKNTTPMPSTSH